MIIEILSNPISFSHMEKEWSTVLLRTNNHFIFQTPQFMHAWWKNFGTGELHILTVRDEHNTLVGVFPLALKNGVLSSLASEEVTDYWDCIVDHRYEQEVYTKFFEFLNQSATKHLHLISLPHTSPTLSEVKKLHSWKIDQKQQTVCPVIVLPKTWDEYLASIGKKQRHEVQRKWKKLEEETEFAVTVVDTDDTIERDCAEFIRLHKLSSPEKAAFWTPTQTQYFFDIMHAAAKNGWLKLYFLEIENERIATMLCFDYNQRIALYNSGYDPQFAHLSVGNVLTSYTIKDGIELGRTYYDFLRGDEEYKFRYGAKPEPIFDLILSRK